MRTATIVCAALFALACNNPKPATATPTVVAPAAAKAAAAPKPTAAPAAKPPAAQPSGKRYSVAVAPTTIKVGGKATTTLTIKPGKGLHFNKDFPSKFVVNAGQHAKCDVAKLSKKSGHVKVVGHEGVVSIPLSAVAAGSEKLSIQGSFSVCSDEQCYVLRGEMLSMAVTVK